MIDLRGEIDSFDSLQNSLFGYSGDSEIEEDEVLSYEKESESFTKLTTMGFASCVVRRAIDVCGRTGASRATYESIEPSPQARDSFRHKMQEIANTGYEDIWSELYKLHGLAASDSDEGGKIWEQRTQTVLKKRQFQEFKSLGRPKTFVKSSRFVLASDQRLIMHRRTMTGFGIPGILPIPRKLDHPVMVPPYFYFENVSSMPISVWDIITRFFHGVTPEFVDSKFFCACRRPRGYVHNLPVEGRKLLIPEPPMTIQELYPRTAQYWPSWDSRDKLHCVNTRSASDSLCKRIRNRIPKEGVSPPISDQKYVIHQCSKWNLIWTGPGQVAPLEAHEIESLLGFDEDHTRGASNKTERIQCLGNAFQVNTVAYHLSVLKPLFPKGLRVLSLFSGIGGAEVALHKLGINLQYVVCVENNPKNRLVIDSWWSKSGQNGKLKHIDDITKLSRVFLYNLIDEVGGFDLVIGGSPCNNFSGNNRVSRVGLEGRESRVFYEFPRILDDVREIMQQRYR